MQVEQIDREAAAKVAVLAEMRELIVAGKADHHAEPFARHRHQARAEVVAEICEWLRDYPAELYKRDIAYTIAYRIEVEFGGRDEK